MNILIAGFGYVSKSIIRYFCEDDYINTYILVRDTEKNRKVSQQCIYKENFIYIPSEKYINKSWFLNLPNFDVVINAAWYSHPADYQTSLQNVDSMQFALTLLEISKYQEIRHFIGIGSCMEYACSDVALRKNDLKNPNNLYSATKVATFFAQKNFFENTSTIFTWVRLFYLFGSTQPQGKLYSHLKENFQLKKKVFLKNAADILDFSHIDDVARAFYQLLHDPIPGEINICSGYGASIYDFAAYVATQYGLVPQRYISKSENLIGKHLVGVPDIKTRPYFEI